MWQASLPWRRLLAPGIAAFICFWLLIALGIWQLHRLAWKEAILANIQRAEISAPIPLPAHPTPFQKIFATGTWIPGKAALYGDEVHDSATGPIPGGELIQPLRLPNGNILLADLGWVPQQTPTPFAPPGPVTLSGYLHDPIIPDWTSGADDPVHGHFYTLNPQNIAAGLKLPAVLPYTLIVMGPLPPTGSTTPQPAQTLPSPPNNHYRYALTWFGFALVLVFEFVLFARKRLLEP